MTDFEVELRVMALRILENVKAGRIYPDHIVAWAKSLLVGVGA